MSIQKSKSDVTNHVNNSINDLNSYLQKLITNGDHTSLSKADKLAYWLTDWSKFLDYESSFNPRKLKRYKRGEIVKVHLGFNVGSEEGGLHYGIVLDNDNSLSNPVITIIPLTSVKPGDSVDTLPDSCLYLGNELFTKVSEKYKKLMSDYSDKLRKIQEEEDRLPADASIEEHEKYNQQRLLLSNDLQTIYKVQRESQRMNQGSIALIGQITVISKIRIYDPKYSHDVLSDIRLSDESLDKIDERISKIYMKEIKSDID